MSMFQVSHTFEPSLDGPDLQTWLNDKFHDGLIYVAHIVLPGRTYIVVIFEKA